MRERRVLRAVLLATALVASAPLAAPEILLPAPVLPPDGFAVLVTVDAPLTAKGAKVTPVPRGERLFLVVPDARAQRVELEAGATHLEVPVGPPVQDVSITLSPATPVKGRDTSAEIRIELKDEQGQTGLGIAPPVLRANVGQVEGLESVGPGQYRARYVLPSTRYPEVAVIMAFAAWPHPQSVHGAVGTLRVPLASAVEVPGRTEANADMSLTIAGREFGPVRAGPDGTFRLPVVVPPGHSMAKGLAVDRLGNRRRVTFDLRLPPTDQLACVVTPRRLPADGVSKARLLCATSDRFGGPTSGSGVRLSVDSGAVSKPTSLGGGVVEWAYTAPRELGSGQVAIKALWKQGPVDSREELSLGLVQGPVANVTVSGAEAVVHQAGTWKADVTATDAQQRPRAGVQLDVTTPQGHAEAPPTGPDGRSVARWTTGAATPLGPATVDVQAYGPGGDEPAALRVERTGAGLAVVVTDLAGLPVPAQRLKIDGVERTSDARGVLLLGALKDGVHELSHVAWPGLAVRVHVRDGGKTIFPVAPGVSGADVKVPVRIAPPAPVVVRLEPAAGAVTWWVESVDGKVLDGREVEVVVDGVAKRATSNGHTRLPIDTSGGSVGVSIADVQTHVLAVSEVLP